ncbi:9164_t:CDS:2 [Entrophospora sp. SA101]|nr:9164_t:CDS:2 [Entrophospora sp. SA101]
MLKFIGDDFELQINPELKEGEKIHVLVMQDETTLQSNDGKKSGWRPINEQPLHKKGQGRTIHISDFLTETIGQLRLLDEQISNNGVWDVKILDESAHLDLVWKALCRKHRKTRFVQGYTKPIMPVDEQSNIKNWKRHISRRVERKVLVSSGIELVQARDGSIFQCQKMIMNLWNGKLSSVKETLENGASVIDIGRF